MESKPYSPATAISHYSPNSKPATQSPTRITDSLIHNQHLPNRVPSSDLPQIPSFNSAVAAMTPTMPLSWSEAERRGRERSERGMPAEAGIPKPSAHNQHMALGGIPSPAQRERARVRVTGADKRERHGEQPPTQTSSPSFQIRAITVHNPRDTPIWLDHKQLYG